MALLSIGTETNIPGASFDPTTHIVSFTAEAGKNYKLTLSPASYWGRYTVNDATGTAVGTISAAGMYCAKVSGEVFIDIGTKTVVSLDLLPPMFATINGVSTDITQSLSDGARFKFTASFGSQYTITLSGGTNTAAPYANFQLPVHHAGVDGRIGEFVMSSADLVDSTGVLIAPATGELEVELGWATLLTLDEVLVPIVSTTVDGGVNAILNEGILSFTTGLGTNIYKVLITSPNAWDQFDVKNAAGDIVGVMGGGKFFSKTTEEVFVTVGLNAVTTVELLPRVFADINGVSTDITSYFQTSGSFKFSATAGELIVLTTVGVANDLPWNPGKFIIETQDYLEGNRTDNFEMTVYDSGSLINIGTFTAPHTGEFLAFVNYNDHTVSSLDTGVTIASNLPVFTKLALSRPLLNSSTASLGASTINLTSTGAQVYRLPITQSGTLSAATTVDGLDTILKLYDSNGVLVAESDDVDWAGGLVGSLVEVPVTTGTYYLFATSYTAEATDTILTISGVTFTTPVTPPTPVTPTRPLGPIVQYSGYRSVADITALNAIPAIERFPGQVVRVEDASGDFRVGAGVAEYTWHETAHRYMLTFIERQPDEAHLIVETLEIINGEVTAQHSPKDGVVFDALVLDPVTSNLLTAVACTCVNNIVNIGNTNYYDGKTLQFSYMYGFLQDRIDQVLAVASNVKVLGVPGVDNLQQVAENIGKQEVLINGKQDELVSGQSIKTINGMDLLGSGDVHLSSTSTIRMLFRGTLTSISSKAPWYPDRAVKVIGYYMVIGTKSTAPVAVTVKKNGSAESALVLPANTVKTAITDVNIDMTLDDYLTVDLSATSGKDLTVYFIYS